MKISILTLFCISILGGVFAQNNTTTIAYKNYPTEVKKLIKAYPDFIIGYDGENIIWKDGTKMLFDDKKKKTFNELLERPDIQDMFTYEYPINFTPPPKYNQDPGRIRNQAFFEKMYGSTKTEVSHNLDTVIWLPSTLHKKILITRINGVNKQLQAVSNILDTMREYRKYLVNIGGTFNWRKISGTDRLSPHSFGIAIDINVKYSNYWRWEMKLHNGKFVYKNRIPMAIVKVFEAHGFIWGGKWYHFDTMHFEYRPELLIKVKQ